MTTLRSIEAVCRLKTLTLAALAAGLLGGCGLTAPRGNAGYADLDSLGMTDVDNTMTLSIGPTLLHFAARHVEDDPETRALLQGLDGVRIRIYEIDRNPDRVAGRIERMSLKLRDQHWEPIALIQEDGEQTHMLVKMERDRIAGLTVIAFDGSEAVVVNVMGDLRPEMFGDTMAALDVETPEVHLAAAGEDIGPVN